ncbi:NIPSNAP family protein [Arcticibacter sp. MXS-1]|uniref:NIPSNAP family protein n=1 Tax=Arcticibacter sp. MXS-1 TaxID=3341726 RepID=UPI0035A969F0
MKISYSRTLAFYFFLLIAALSVSSASAVVPPQYFYQLKIYHFTTTAQESRLNDYLQKAYVPALHAAGIKNVGVLKPIAGQTVDSCIYVFIPFRTQDEMSSIDDRLNKNKEYLKAGSNYLDADFKNAPYTRIETIILKAFTGMPAPEVPTISAKKADRVYELRSYESATEKYHVNKVRMFNEGDEIGLFKRLGFNAVFYSSVVAGSHMPNLMYMTAFNNREDRDKHWKAFGNDPQWKTLSARPEYQNNVSHIDILFLRPADYSDF